MVTLVITYALAGAVAGVLAGLLGVGGGIVIVPMLVYCFGLQQFDPAIAMKMALGTSLASIMFTSVSSALTHHKYGAVEWSIVRRIVFGILAGTLMGSIFATYLPGGTLKGIFVVFLYFVATQMLLGKKPKASRHLPNMAGMTGAGGIIGIVSGIVGIGGGTLSVPYMVWHNVPLHHAVGTSAAIGFPIAVSGTIGYIISGLSRTDLPDFSLGFVYLPALIGLVLMSMMTAPLGVKLAHSLPVPKLKRIFAILLYIVATRMLISIL